MSATLDGEAAAELEHALEPRSSTRVVGPGAQRLAKAEASLGRELIRDGGGRVVARPIE